MFMENYTALGYLLSQSKETSHDLHQVPSKSLLLAGIKSDGCAGKKNSCQPAAHSTFAWLLEWTLCCPGGKWEQGNTSGEIPTSLSELTQGAHCLLCKHTVEPSAVPSSKQAHQRLAGKQECCLRCIFKGKQLGVSKRDAHLWGVCSSFSPQGLQASILMSQSMQSHTPVWSAWWIVPEFAPTGSKNNSEFTFTEVSVTTVSTKQRSLTLEPGKPPLHNLITSKKLTGKMLVSSISHLPSNTVCKVHRTAYMYEQMAIFQNCFSSLESTLCTTENTFILQSIWPKVYEGGKCQRCPANVFSFNSQRGSPLVTRQSLN